MVLPRSANMCSSQPTLYCQKVIQDEIPCTKHFKLFSLEPPPRSSEQRQRRSWFTNSMSEEAGSSIVSSQRKKCTSKSYGNRNLRDLHCQRLPVMVPSCPFHPQFSWAEPSDHGSTCDRGIAQGPKEHTHEPQLTSQEESWLSKGKNPWEGRKATSQYQGILAFARNRL